MKVYWRKYSSLATGFTTGTRISRSITPKIIIRTGQNQRDEEEYELQRERERELVDKVRGTNKYPIKRLHTVETWAPISR